MRNERFPWGTYNKLKWKKIEQCKGLRTFTLTAYEIELSEGVDISPIFNVVDLYHYHEGHTSKEEGAKLDYQKEECVQ